MRVFSSSGSHFLRKVGPHLGLISKGRGEPDAFVPHTVRMGKSGVEVWYEDGEGLLFAGWYAADDDGRLGPYETKAEAEQAGHDDE